MCFNEEASWVSLGLTTGFNVISMYYINDYRYVAIALLWQWVIVMQLAEGLAYRGREMKNKWLSTFAAQLALMANISQPLMALLFLTISNGNNVHRYLLYIAYIVSILYSVYICVSLSGQQTYLYLNKECDLEYCRACETGECHSNFIENWINIKIESIFGDEKEECGHFVYTWWKDMKWNAVPYLLCLAVVLICLLKPLEYMIYQVALIYILLGISMLYFKTGVGSVWCFFASFTPILNTIAWKILVK